MCRYRLTQTISPLSFLNRYGLREISRFISGKSMKFLQYIYLHEKIKRSPSGRVKETEENREFPI
jgi:flavoprotein